MKVADNARQRDFTLITTEAGLAGLNRRLREAGRIAIDTEADSLHHYFEKICLIQISLADEHYIVDPLAAVDLTPLIAILAERPLIFHGADYDLRMLLSSFGFRPRAGLFDTMLAALLLGDPRPGLASLVERHFGKHLSKRAQKADWARRPLRENMLTYAADDTRYLAALADLLRADLDRLGRGEWHREWCERLIESTGEVREKDPDEVWRLRGAGRLGPRPLCFLRALWHWREEEARRIDRPPFMVLSNDPLLELAKWLAARPDRAVEGFAGLGTRHAPDRLARLRDAVALARSLPEAEWPQRKRGQRPNHCGQPVKPLRQEAARLAADLGLDPAVLAPRAAVEAIAHARPRDEEALRRAGDLMRWQAQVLAPTLLPLLEVRS